MASLPCLSLLSAFCSAALHFMPSGRFDGFKDPVFSSCHDVRFSICLSVLCSCLCRPGVPVGRWIPPSRAGHGHCRLSLSALFLSRFAGSVFCAAQTFRWVVGYRRLALATDFVYLLCSPIRVLVPLSFRVGLVWYLLASLSVVRWGGVRSRDGAVANKTKHGPYVSSVT